MSETNSQYGINDGGFVRMRMPEILSAIANSFKVRTGLDLDLTPDSVVGQVVNICSEREAFLWELAEKAFLSAFPVTATGAALDLAVSYAGVKRIRATATDARAIFVGDQGTVLPAGLVVESTQLVEGAATPPRFATNADITITREAAAQVQLRMPNPIVVGQEYWIDWQTFRATYTAILGDDESDVASALSTQLLGFGAGASVLGATVSISSGTQFTVNWSSNIINDLLGSPGMLYCEDTGPIPAPAGTLTNIITPVTGLRFVTNINDARPGTNHETDAELRHRYTDGVYRLGAATPQAILANLTQEITAATNVAVYENITDVTNGDGMPPHSLEVVIEGGDDATIAQRIYDLKPGGIQTHGNTSFPVVDSSGFTQDIYFSRPEQRQIWLKAVLTTTSEEEVPGNVLELARSAMLEAGSLLGTGDNVYLQRISAAIFKATTGVASVALTATSTAVGAPTPAGGSYTSADIAIGTRQRAVFTASAIQVS